MININDLIKVLPKWLKPLMAITILILIVFILKKEAFPESSTKECTKISVRGKLLNEMTKIPISQLKITIENSSSLTSSQTTLQGSFLLENVSLPASNTLRLIIVDLNEELQVQQIDIDLTNKSLFDEENCTLDIGTHYINSKKAKRIEQTTKENSPKTFSLLPKNIQLISLIESQTKFKFNTYSPLTIKVTYSNSIPKIEQTNLHYYEGGHLVIKVNDSPCNEFSDYLIKPTPKFGNPLPQIHKHLDAEIDSIIHSHCYEIAEAIKNCL